LTYVNLLRAVVSATLLLSLKSCCDEALGLSACSVANYVGGKNGREAAGAHSGRPAMRNESIILSDQSVSRVWQS
jgi:hypothetical protein